MLNTALLVDNSSMSRMEWDDWNDIDMSFDQKLIHYVGRMARGRENIFQPTVDPLSLAHNTFDAVAAQATNQQELDHIDIDGIILASHGLDPALPWTEYGLFGDDDEQRRNAIPAHILEEMDAQVHRSSLMTSADARMIAEDTEDEIWEKMKVEIIENSPFRHLLCSLVPVHAGSRIFRLHLRADNRLQTTGPDQQSGLADRDQSTDKIEQDDILDCDEVEPIPEYSPAELEEWTSHLQLTERRSIHWVCLQSVPLANSLKEEFSHHPIDLDSASESEHCGETGSDAGSGSAAHDTADALYAEHVNTKCYISDLTVESGSISAAHDAAQALYATHAQPNCDTIDFMVPWPDIVTCLSQSPLIQWDGCTEPHAQHGCLLSRAQLLSAPTGPAGHGRAGP
eukprot:1371617-Rhodomonas_salina.2